MAEQDEWGTWDGSVDPAPAHRGRGLERHATDATSLVVGIVLLGIAAVWLLVQLDWLSLPSAGVVLPGVLVAAGAVGLVATLRRS